MWVTYIEHLQAPTAEKAVNLVSQIWSLIQFAL